MNPTHDIPLIFSFLQKTGRSISYTRIGPADKDDQQIKLNADLQFVDNVGCKSAEPRPKLVKCLAELQPDDVLFVKSMDRLGRNTRELLELIKQITNKGTCIFFLDEDLALDPTRAEFESSFRWLTSMYDFERNLAQERRNEGLLKAKKKGIRLGRPTKVTEEQRQEIKQRLTKGEKAPALAKKFGVSESLVYTIGREG